MGQSQQWIMQAAGYLNCRILSMPFTYLGIPIGANPRRSELWDPIIRKSEKKHIKFIIRVIYSLVMTDKLMDK